MGERTLRARLEAETSGFSSRMAAAEAQMQRMERAPVAAARGMGILRSSMQQLAFEATGTTGPLGRAVGAIAMLGVGSTAVLSFTAGVGAMVLLLKDFRAGAEEAGKAADAAEKRITALIAKTSPAAAAMAARQAKGAELETAKQALSLTIGKQFAAQQLGLPISAAKFAREAAEQQRLVNRLTQEYNLLGVESRKATEGALLQAERRLKIIASEQVLRRFDIEQLASMQKLEQDILRALRNQQLTVEDRLKLELQLREVRRAEKLPFLEVPTPSILGIPSIEPRGRTFFEEQAERAAAEIPTLEQFMDLAFGTQARIARFGPSVDPRLIAEAALVNEGVMTATERRIATEQELKELLDAGLISHTTYNRAIKQGSEVAAMAIMGIGAAVQGLIAGSGGGGAGGFFGGLLGLAGGIVGAGVKGLFAANPLLGAGLTVAGGIVSTIAARGSRQEVQPVRDDRNWAELQRLRQELAKRRPVIVNTYIVDPITGQARKIKETVAESERFDAVSRFGAGNVVEVEG